jgi:hypothetical protein
LIQILRIALLSCHAQVCQCAHGIARAAAFAVGMLRKREKRA